MALQCCRSSKSQVMHSSQCWWCWKTATLPETIRWPNWNISRLSTPHNLFHCDDAVVNMVIFESYSEGLVEETRELRQNGQIILLQFEGYVCHLNGRTLICSEPADIVTIAISFPSVIRSSLFTFPSSGLWSRFFSKFLTRQVVTPMYRLLFAFFVLWTTHIKIQWTLVTCHPGLTKVAVVLPKKRHITWSIEQITLSS